MNDSRPLLAAAWMTGAIGSFIAMAIAGRFVLGELDTFELMAYRSLIGVVLVLVIARVTGTIGQINAQNFHLHIFRNVFHFTGQNLWFFAITLIPLAQVVALEFTTPLWVILLAPFFLGERITATRWFAVLLGFAGILIVVRPEFSTLSIGLLAAAGCAIGFAGSFIFTKILTRSASITCILFYLVTTQSIMGLALAGYDGDMVLPSASAIPWVVVVGIGGLVAHFSITKALTLAPATIVGPLDFARLPLVAFVGYLMFSEPLDIFVFIGAALILGANYINILSESRKRGAQDR